MTYRAPLMDIRFVLKNIADLPTILKFAPFDHADNDTIYAVLEEAAKLAGEVVAPLNRIGDQQGSRLQNGAVQTPEGFKEAYKQFREGGWNAVPVAQDLGGVGFPWAVSLAVQEMLTSASMGFALCSLLTQGAIELLSAHGSEDQKQIYLSKLVSGEWTGTMNLTEPQAGSDVGAVKTRAIKQKDGTYRIMGSKIFISYGDHDMAENIVHLVLARTPDAAPGTKGISCFIVPKFLIKADGSLGERNDLRVVSLEHKLGIHASPTCVMSFGDNDGAIGYLIGEEQTGMRCMFTMMNNARLSVGLQGLAIAERAYQLAFSYAMERRQGRPVGSSDPNATIIHHPDVRRMLMTSKAYIEAMRALLYFNGAMMDVAHGHVDTQKRMEAQSLVELLIPISKAWCTDLGVEVSSLGVQVCGGMGFIEETGAAQHLRDSRIAPIYEGTNGIQALDLISRKLPMEGGSVVRRFLAEMQAFTASLATAGEALASVRTALAAHLLILNEATEAMLGPLAKNPMAQQAGATPYLRLFGTVVGGYLLCRGAAAAAQDLVNDPKNIFLKSKISTAQFYCEQILPQASGLLAAAIGGADSLFAIPVEALSA